MTLDSQTKSLHYVHAYAVKDRIDYSCYSGNRDAGEWELYSILPTHQDYLSLKERFVVHVLRIIVMHLTFFKKDFKGLVPKHLPHRYSSEMSERSEVVSVVYDHASSVQHHRFCFCHRVVIIILLALHL